MRLLVFCVALPVLAHDMWIEPASFRPDRGEIVNVRLKVGQDFLGDPLPRAAQLINQFVVLDSEGRKPMVGRDGQDPAGVFRIAGPGMHVLGYFSNPSVVEETAEKFNQYLKEEGLDGIAAVRAQRGEMGKPVREQFSRCAKSLVLAGAPDGSGDRVLGFPLELVAERNPYLVRTGGELPVRLIYQNKPLAGALVVAMNRLRPMEKVSARTDADGRVRLKIGGAGVWMIKAVHAVPAVAGANADWSSYWASLTLEVGSVMRETGASAN